MNRQQLSTICYIDNGTHFLLLKRDKKENDQHHGKYISVGGKFEAGETPEQCAIREIKEETGLTAQKLDWIGLVTFPDFTHDGRDWYSFVFRVREFTGELIKDCPEGTLEWVPYEEVMDKPTWQGDYQLFEWVLNERPFFSAQFTYDEDEKLVDQMVTFYEGVK